MKNEKRLRVAFIYGGVSPEHEISVITGVQAMAAAKGEFDVIPLYVAKSGELYTGEALKDIGTYSKLSLIPKLAKHAGLPEKSSQAVIPLAEPKPFSAKETPFDVLFPCFHGGVGEGGWIQGIAEAQGIPMVGTGLTGAVIGMDKVAMKHAFAAAGIPQASYLWFYRQEWQEKKNPLLKTITGKFSFPLFVKPSRGGSSIGTTRATDKQSLIRAIDLAAALDTRVVVEEGIENAREFNISVMGNAGNTLETSAIEEVFHGQSDFLGFEEKYLTGGKTKGMAGTDRQIPAEVSGDVAKKIADIAKQVFRLFDCGGLVRIDFLAKGKQVYCVEINTIPGSLSFYIWDKSGYTYPELIKRLVDLATIRDAENRKTARSFASNVLEDAATSLGNKLGKKLSG